jgi:hypothetical protein
VGRNSQPSDKQKHDGEPLEELCGILCKAGKI